MQREKKSSLKPLLFLLFLGGFLLNLLIVIDPGLFGWMRPEADPASKPKTNVFSKKLVQIAVAKCAGGGETIGSGFAIGPGYLATTAHIVAESQQCGAPITVTDSEGRSSEALLEKISKEVDLALLRGSDPDQPAFSRADFEPSPETFDGEVTSVNIRIEKAAGRIITSSSEGRAIYRPGTKRLELKDLILDPITSGAPVISKQGRIVGVVLAVQSTGGNTAATATRYAAPASALLRLYSEAPAKSLP